MDISDRLKEVVSALNISQKELADNLNIRANTFSQYLTGTRKIPLDLLSEFALFSKCDLNWLITGRGEMFLSEPGKVEDGQAIKLKPKTELNADKLKHYLELGKSKSQQTDIPSTNSTRANSNSVVSLPIVGEIAAGNPFEVTDMSDLGNIIVSTELISDPDNFYCFRVNGWSMSPEIQHSDVVIINKIYEYDDMDNRIVAIRIDDGITLKLLKLDHDNKCSWLMPINDDYKPILINQYSTIIILGVLEYSIRSYK